MSPARINTASDSVNEIATVRIELRHTDPLIWRQVEVPTSIALKVLHDIIQAVMGWVDYHLWEFTIGKQKYGLPMDEDWGSRQRLMAGKVRLRDVLQVIASVRGAVNGLMAEVIEDHVRCHVGAPSLAAKERAEGTDDLIEIVHAYLKCLIAQSSG
jgi:DNA-binding FrmR family transcriptional regulator